MHILYQKERIHIFFLQATYFVIKHRVGFYLVDRNVKSYKLHITVNWHHTVTSRLMIPCENMVFISYKNIYNLFITCVDLRFS